MAVAVKTRAASPAKIVAAALNTRTLADAQALYETLVTDIGGRYERPVADRTNNHGMLTSQGSYDHKLLELITNGQDAVLELFARCRFGDLAKVPYFSPREAASHLLGELRPEEQAALLRIDIYEGDGPARRTKLVTPVVRDFGCGITTAAVPQTIFFYGSDHKDALLFLQGAFGMGGALTYRNAQAVVLITRREPGLLEPGEQDRITVAVCLWQQHQKGRGLFYPVTTAWPDDAGAEPWSCPADSYPEFEPGTQIALVDYATEGFHTGRNDRRGFEFMVNTRLWEPVFPIRFNNHVATGDHEKTARGLKQRFDENKRRDRKEGTDILAYRYRGKTYHLPVSFCYFERGQAADEGGMRNFIYGDHALMFSSNGQCHKHWTPQEFRYKVERLSKLYDRLLVVVETDPLPIELRTTLFTPDRSGFVNEPDARRLEDAVAGLLADWDELREYNKEVVLKSLERRNERPTLAIARKIARELKLRGFRLRRRGGMRERRKRFAEAELWPDPTAFEGPDELTLVAGETRFIHYHLNAVDEFFSSRRGRLELECDHPRIGSDELTIGPLRGGMVRVSLVVPEDVEPSEAKLIAHVRDWERAAGGIGNAHRWETTLTILVEKPERQPPLKRKKKDREEETPDEGPLVALVWRGKDDGDEWHGGNPGNVEPWPAQALAEKNSEYRELAKLGDVDVPTIVLNMDYSPLESYVRARLDGDGVRNLTTAGAEKARERYAVGVGLGLLLHDQERERLRKGGHSLDEASDLHQRQAIARAVLVMMPEYDTLLERLEE
jgi:hypothetical protein